MTMSFLKKPLFWILTLLFAVFLSIVTVCIFLFFPSVDKLAGCFETSLYQVKVCPGDRHYTPINQISLILKRAIVVSEDGTFYSHSGFDWFELRQSLLKNLRSLRYERGGSTITQQLAKNAFLSKEKSILRKIHEAILAHKIEKRFSKETILEKYLNMVEFGPQIYGIKIASEKYFQKSPARLHLLEAVWLAHVLPNPKVFSRGIKTGSLSDYSQKRLQILLQRLVKYGDINQAQYSFAKDQIASFPWKHLSQEDFENPFINQEGQDDAIQRLMESEDWIEENSIDEEPLEEIEQN